MSLDTFRIYACTEVTDYSVYEISFMKSRRCKNHKIYHKWKYFKLAIKC